MQAGVVHLGTAGWAIPRPLAVDFPDQGSGIARYAARLTAVEINSTFYRSHLPSTYARWAAVTPEKFRFALKAPRTITHEARLAGCDAALAAFLREARQLGEKLGAVLIQLPPSLVFDAATADRFFQALRLLEPDLAVASEPRHRTWFATEADALLEERRVARVAADPAPHPSASQPGGWQGFTYHRLHGSPRMYYSSYDQTFLRDLAGRLRRTPAGSWCIFDNTASGAAAKNALEVQGLMSGSSEQL